MQVAKDQAAKQQAAKDAAVQKAADAKAARLGSQKDQAARAEAAKEEAAKARAAKLAAAKDAAAQKKQDNPPKKDIPKKQVRVAVADPTPVDPYAPPKTDPATAYKTGFQQYVRGDTSGALATFKGALSSSPGYPPTYRGLGLVYEKMGQKGAAKLAFKRYLQLSPNASDAEQIKDRMEKLGS